MERMQKVLVTTGVLVFLVIGFLLVTGTITKFTGMFISEEVLNNEQKFANCLKERGVVLYINSENAFETLENSEVKDYLQYFYIINCLRNKQVCIEVGVNDFSKTYVFVIGEEKIDGDIDVFKLSEISECKLK